MAEVNKTKLQLRTGVAVNGDKTPSPATKLLISHGKPNFTIQRSSKAQNGNVNPLSPAPAAAKTITFNNYNNHNSEFVVRSTTFNGVFKPSSISVATKQTLPQHGDNLNNSTSNRNDNEASKVVLRRAKVVQTEVREDENVPEFIRRQRRIQERLANQNILDFENRRSGYFTQVMISPSSPNRQSFVETMASPAIKPGLEMPPPSQPAQELIEEETAQQNQHQQQQQQHEQPPIEFVETIEDSVMVHAEPVTINGQVEEEEVVKAIEEVNKAVEGEDDDKVELEGQVESSATEIEQTQEQAIVTSAVVEEEVIEAAKEDGPVVAALITSAPLLTEESLMNGHEVVAAVVTSAPLVTKEPMTQQNGHEEVLSVVATTEATHINGIVTEEPIKNGHTTNGEASENGITISHTNGLNGPSIPSPDPAGEKGANFEPKTVVSFSQELGNGVNKYPDTVKVVKDAEPSEVDSELKELTKLKFEIKADNEEIEVKPVLVTETA